MKKGIVSLLTVGAALVGVLVGGCAADPTPTSAPTATLSPTPTATATPTPTPSRPCPHRNADADTHADTNCNTCADANPRPGAYRHTFSRRHTDTSAHGGADRGPHPDSNSRPLGLARLRSGPGARARGRAGGGGRRQVRGGVRPGEVAGPVGRVCRRFRERGTLLCDHRGGHMAGQGPLPGLRSIRARAIRRTVRGGPGRGHVSGGSARQGGRGVPPGW